jgi:hypothetical protein
MSLSPCLKGPITEILHITAVERGTRRVMLLVAYMCQLALLGYDPHLQQAHCKECQQGESKGKTKTDADA